MRWVGVGLIPGMLPHNCRDTPALGGDFGALILSISALTFRRSDPRPSERTLLFLLGRAKVVLASDPKDKELMDKREIKQQTKKFFIKAFEERV